MDKLKVTTDLLYSLLPSIYRVEDENLKYPLKRFLDVLVQGGIIDLENKIASFTDLFDADRCPPEYLPHLAAILGFEFPHNLTSKEQRRFIKNMANFYMIKGTKRSLEFIIRELLAVDVEISSVDTVNRTFEVLCTPDISDPKLAEKEDKVVQMVELYKPGNSTAFVTFGYTLTESCALKVIESQLLDTMLVTNSLNRKNGFVINRLKRSALNTPEIEVEY